MFPFDREQHKNGLVVDDVLGAKVAIKYGNGSNGGWHIAVVCALPPDTPPPETGRWNCVLDYIITDRTKVETYLDMTNEVSGEIARDQKFKKFSWVMLVDETECPDPDTEGVADIMNPTSTQGPGRPQTTRFAPSSGPTARGVPRRSGASASKQTAHTVKRGAAAQPEPDDDDFEPAYE